MGRPFFPKLKILGIEEPILKKFPGDWSRSVTEEGQSVPFIIQSGKSPTFLLILFLLKIQPV